MQTVAVPGQQAVAEVAEGALRLQKNQAAAAAAANVQHLRIDFQALDFHDGETGNILVEVGSYCGILAAAAVAVDAVDGKDGMQRLRPLRRSKRKEKIELFWQ